MYKITKMPLQAKITKIPQHQYFTDLSENVIILPNYPHIVNYQIVLNSDYIN